MRHRLSTVRKKVELFEKICSDDGVGNISNNENMRKRATKTKVEFEHVLVVGLSALSVGSLEREATVKLLAICEQIHQATTPH